MFITSSWKGFQPQAVHVSGDTPADAKNRKSVLVSDLNPGTEYCVRMSFSNDRTFVSPKSERKCAKTPKTSIKFPFINTVKFLLHLPLCFFTLKRDRYHLSSNMVEPYQPFNQIMCNKNNTLTYGCEI